MVDWDPVRRAFRWVSAACFVVSLVFLAVSVWSPGAVNAAVAFTVIGGLSLAVLLTWSIADRSPL